MSVDLLLSKLDKVRQTGPDRWVACCPAHGDKHPSLNIRDDNGTILLHCFGQQCGAEAIVSAIGLSLSDLFPEKCGEDKTHLHRQGKKRYSTRAAFNAADVLECLTKEALVVALASRALINFYADLLKKFPETELQWYDVCLSQETHDRLVEAAARIEAGRALANAR